MHKQWNRWTEKINNSYSGNAIVDLWRSCHSKRGPIDTPRANIEQVEDEEEDEGEDDWYTEE